MAILRRAVAFGPALVSGSSNQASQVAEQLNKLIELQEAAGWRFSHLDHLTTYVQAGCWGSFVGHKSEVVNAHLAIFEKEE